MSYSGRQPTGAGHDKVATRNYLSRKESKRPISHSPSPDFESLHSTAAVTVCELSPSQLDRITQPYCHSYIARVFAKDICPRQLAARLNRHLHLTSSVEVSKLNRGNFVLKFSEKDYLTLLRVDHPWSIPNLCIHAVRWIPNFKPSDVIMHVVDAWIRLQELPVEYYDHEILRQIAESIGQALVKIDPVTKDRWKCKYARICVRLNLCDPLPSMIRIGGIRQEIEYEGFDLLCPRCRRVLDNCLCHPSGSSRARMFQGIGSSSNSKQLLISSESSVAWGSRYQILGEEPQAQLLDLSDCPSPSVGGSKTAATWASPSSLQPQLPGLVAEPIENLREICGVSAQILPEESARREEMLQIYPISISSNPEAASTTIEVPVELEQKNLIPFIALHDHPMSISSYPEAASTTTTTLKLEQNNSIPSIAFHDHPMPISSYPEAAVSTTIAAPAELELNNSNLSIALASFVVEDKFREAETCSSTTLAVHNNQLLPSSPTASILSPQPSPTSETALSFYSNVIKRSIIEKEITNTPFEGNSISRCPILYTIDPSISSFAVGLSEGPNSVPKQNQFVINIMSSSRSGNEHGIGSEAVSAQQSKKMLGWKFCGRDNANLIEGLKYVVQKYETSIVVIFASWISDDDVDKVVGELAFYGSYCKKFDDCNHGAWLLMFKQDVQTEVFEAPQQDFASAYADTETSWQTWGPASFCDSTYSMANTLAY